MNRTLAETQSVQIAQNIAANSPQAQVLTSGVIAQKEITLLVEGFASKALMRRVQDVFQRHTAQVVFFLPATTAAAHPQTLRALVQEGHTLGNYMLTGAACRPANPSGTGQQSVPCTAVAGGSVRHKAYIVQGESVCLYTESASSRRG